MVDDTKKGTFFGLVWWNVNNFFHYRPEEAMKRNYRWPRSKEEYQEKCRRVDVALVELFALVGIPKIIALGEITRKAAAELRDRLLPHYKLISLDVKVDVPTSQVAVLYSPDGGGISFEEQLPFIVPRTPRGTRPMAVLDVLIDDYRIRVVICHWQARIDEGSDSLRHRMADYLSGECYDFIDGSSGKRHMAIVGDFNEEPYENSLGVLNAHRHRARSQGKHWSDGDVKRVHLYNTAWRMLGEQRPNPQSEIEDAMLLNCAGTYYWKQDRSWHHFDQLIVSGGLIGKEFPHIDEAGARIVSSAAFMTDGLPLVFSRRDGKFSGLSDHLPIHANICI